LKQDISYFKPLLRTTEPYSISGLDNWKMRVIHQAGLRKIIVYILLVAVVGVIGYILVQGPSTIGDIPDDFVGYWTAGRLLAFQENPYSLENFVSINEGLGFTTIVLLPVFYPPTVLPVFMLFGLIPYPISRFIWLILSISLIFYCGLWLWRIIHGPNEKRWVIIICVLSFAPIYFSLIEGQITFLILLGLVGFLYYINENQWFKAGLFLSLLLIKFQLIYLILVAVLFWVIFQKRWKVIAGTILASGLLVGITIIFQPSIISDYIIFILSNTPSHCGYVSISALFCLINQEDWLFRYLPTILGVIWVSLYFFRSRDDWIWLEKISILLFVSLITAPLTWMHDQLLFLVPIIEVAVLILARKFGLKEESILFVYVVVNIIAISLVPENRFRQYVFIWMPVVLFLLYLYSKRSFSKIILEKNDG
jgi:hypothetical protein